MWWSATRPMVKDAALNAAYRSRYSTCHMKYSLAVPFTERFFELALPGKSRRHPGESRGPDPGARLDSGLRRNDAAMSTGLGAGRPVGDTVRTVMGIKSESAYVMLPLAEN